MAFVNALRVDGQHGATALCRALLETYANATAGESAADCAENDVTFAVSSPTDLRLGSMTMSFATTYAGLATDAAARRLETALHDLGFFALDEGGVRYVTISAPESKVVGFVSLGFVTAALLVASGLTTWFRR